MQVLPDFVWRKVSQYDKKSLKHCLFTFVTGANFTSGIFFIEYLHIYRSSVVSNACNVLVVSSRNIVQLWFIQTRFFYVVFTSLPHVFGIFGKSGKKHFFKETNV